MCPKELILISQINQRSVWFAIIGILKTLVINKNQMFVMIYQFNDLYMS